MLIADLLPLFAQGPGRFGPGNQPPPPDPAAVAGGMIGFFVCYGVILLASLVVSILFLLALYRALNACSPRNRTMEPGQVWLSLIPLVGIVFYIMAILKVPESLEREYRSRGMRDDGDYGKNLGIWFIVTSFVCPGVNVVLWIMYWVKISGLTKGLAGRPARSDYDDEDDDRPRRRSSRRDDDDEDEDDDRPRRRRRDED
jgi:hypothetical protein